MDRTICFSFSVQVSKSQHLKTFQGWIWATDLDVLWMIVASRVTVGVEMGERITAVFNNVSEEPCSKEASSKNQWYLNLYTLQAGAFERIEPVNKVPRKRQSLSLFVEFFINKSICGEICLQWWLPEKILWNCILKEFPSVTCGIRQMYTIYWHAWENDCGYMFCIVVDCNMLFYFEI